MNLADEHQNQNEKNNKQNKNMIRREVIEKLDEDPLDSPPSISEELKRKELENMRFAELKTAPPKVQTREINPFMINTEHILKKPAAAPGDFEVEVIPRSAFSSTHYSWGFWPFKVNYAARNALRIRDHTKWLSKQHVIDDHWEAVFLYPQKLDSFEITWTNPPERFRIFFKQSDGSHYIALTELIEKYKPIEAGKLNSKDNVGLSDAFLFHKPIFAKRIRIAMNKPTKQDMFGIEWVRFYEKRTTILIKNSDLDPNKQMCLWVNTPMPKEYDRVEIYSCVDAIQVGDNRELWVYYTDKTIRHFISHMCIGFDDKYNLVLRQCMDNDPTFKLEVNTDGTISFNGFDDRIFATNNQDRTGINFVTRDTEISVTSQADSQMYKKENITLGGQGYWMSQPGQTQCSMQLFFGKTLTGYQNKKVDNILISWQQQPREFMVYSWRQGSSWTLLQKFKDLKGGVGTSSIQVLGQEFSAIMIFMSKPNVDQNGLFTFAIGSVRIASNSMTMAYETKTNAGSLGIKFDFDIQYNTTVTNSKNYNNTQNKFSLAADKFTGLYKKVQSGLRPLNMIKMRAINHKMKLGIGLKYINQNAKDRLNDFVNNALNYPTNANFLNAVKQFAPYSQCSGLTSQSSGTPKLGSTQIPGENCLALKVANSKIQSGFYYIKTECSYKPIRVYCDFDLGIPAVDIYIENDENTEPDPDLRHLNVRDYMDVREVCAKIGLEPIQISNEKLLPAIAQVLKSLGYTLQGRKVVPLGFDYSCETGTCLGNFNSFNDRNTIPINTFTNAIPAGAGSTFMDFLGITESTLQQVATGSTTLPYFKFKGEFSNLSGIICSTNQFDTKSIDNNVIRVSCEMNVSNNGDLFQLGKTVLVKCPPGCNRSMGVIWGERRYYGSSLICKAAIHARKLSVEGGKIFVNVLPPNKSNYQSIQSEGINSEFKNPDSQVSFSFTKFQPTCKIDLIKRLRKNTPKNVSISPQDSDRVKSFDSKNAKKKMGWVDKLKGFFSFMELTNNITPIQFKNENNNQVNNTQLQGISNQPIDQNKANVQTNLLPNNLQNTVQTNTNQAKSQDNFDQSKISQNKMQSNQNLAVPQKVEQMQNDQNLQQTQTTIPNLNTKMVNGYIPQNHNENISDILKKHHQPTQDELKLERLKYKTPPPMKNNILVDTDFNIPESMSAILKNNNEKTNNYGMKIDGYEHGMYKDNSINDIVSEIENFKNNKEFEKYEKPANATIIPDEVEHVKYIDRVPNPLMKEVYRNRKRQYLKKAAEIQKKNRNLEIEGLDIIDEKDLNEMGFTKKRLEEIKKLKKLEEKKNKVKNTNNQQSNTEFDKLRFAQVQPNQVVERAAATGIEKAITKKVEAGVLSLFGIHDKNDGYQSMGIGLNGELNGDAAIAADALGLGMQARMGVLGGNGTSRESGNDFRVSINNQGQLTVGTPGDSGKLWGERGQLIGGANQSVGLGGQGAAFGIGSPENGPAYLLAANSMAEAKDAAGAAALGRFGSWMGANPSIGNGYGVAGKLGVGSGLYPGHSVGFNEIHGAMGAGAGAVDLGYSLGHYRYGGENHAGGAGGGGGGAYAMGSAYGYGKGGISAFVSILIY